MVVVMIGPAGAGKTTIGRALATSLGWPFVDGDEYHAQTSLEKIRRGEPLTDRERTPWLATLRARIERALDRREPLVLACSALKARYRVALAGDLRGVRLVYLKVPREVLRDRLAKRQGHIAGPEILESQLADLEEPADDLVVDATADPQAVVRRIRRELGL
jgi:gluconokinase